ncbi:MAG: SprT family zinc-dependent metalloprotease [Candidatus Gracilibacteria bacterium]|nr:SprT family zinc-dependent metalloprotease [Candidatus Gracilibacteria bacterium]
MSKIPPFEIIRASRRSLSLQISQKKGLVVRAPFSVPLDIIHAFVERKTDWIEKYLARHTERKEQKGTTLYYLGQVYSFEYNLLQKETVLQSEGIFIFSGKVQEVSAEQKILTGWYRKQAQKHMNERVTYFSEKHGFSFKQIRITSATTRWGSCSGRNNLNFPWRLLMAPREVIDYVVVHELAHTIHKNHSSHFWGLVESIVPDWKAHRTHLREEGWRYEIPKF